MGAAVKGSRKGGSRPKGVKGVQKRHDTGGFALWVGDVGVNGAYGEGPGQFTVQGGKEDHGEEAATKEGREMVLLAIGESNEGDGDVGDKDINYPEAEYGRKIYYDAADSGPMRAGHPAARRAGVSAVVGTDRDRPDGSARKGGSISGGNIVGVR